MKQNIEIDGNNYKIIENNCDAFQSEEFESKYTDYFKEFDYIVGDISYGKMRLKGFNKKDNKNFNKINDYENVKDYIKNNCSFGCKYFILEKQKSN